MAAVLSIEPMTQISEPGTVVLNGWFDFYHPLGILFDIIIVIVWAATWFRSR